jgi:hypothetical protein
LTPSNVVYSYVNGQSFTTLSGVRADGFIKATDLPAIASKVESNNALAVSSDAVHKELNKYVQDSIDYVNTQIAEKAS